MNLLKKPYAPINWPRVQSIRRTNPPMWEYNLLQFAIKFNMRLELPEHYTVFYRIFETPTN